VISKNKGDDRNFGSRGWTVLQQISESTLSLVQHPAATCRGAPTTGAQPDWPG